MSYNDNFPGGFAPSVDHQLDKRSIIADVDAADQYWLNTCYVGMPFFNQADGKFYVVKATDKTQAGLVYESLGEASTSQIFKQITTTYDTDGSISIPAGAVKAYVKLIGGGASSANKGTDVNFATVNHGNPGNTVEAIYEGAALSALGTTVAVAIGPGGVAVTGNGVEGNPGGDTSFAGLTAKGGKPTGAGESAVTNDSNATSGLTVDPTSVITDYVYSGSKVSIIDLGGGNFAGEIPRTGATAFGGTNITIDAGDGTDKNPDNATGQVGDSAGLGGTGALTIVDTSADVNTSKAGNKGKVVVTFLIQQSTIPENIIYPHDETLAYTTNQSVYKDNAIYQANDDIPANTTFAEGVSGATWRLVVGGSSSDTMNTIEETRDPTVNDDINNVNHTVRPGTHWLNTTREATFICIENTDGAAVWKELVYYVQSDTLHYETLESTTATNISPLTSSYSTVKTINFSNPRAGKYRLGISVPVILINAGLPLSSSSGGASNAPVVSVSITIDGVAKEVGSTALTPMHTTATVDLEFYGYFSDSIIIDAVANAEVIITAKVSTGLYDTGSTLQWNYNLDARERIELSELPGVTNVPIRAGSFGVSYARNPTAADNTDADENNIIGQSWTNSVTGSLFRCKDAGGVDGTGSANWVKVTEEGDFATTDLFSDTNTSATTLAAASSGTGVELDDCTVTVPRAGWYLVDLYVNVQLNIANSEDTMLYFYAGVQHDTAGTTSFSNYERFGSEIFRDSNLLFNPDFRQTHLMYFSESTVIRPRLNYSENGIRLFSGSKLTVLELPGNGTVPLDASNFGLVYDRNPVASDKWPDNPDVRLGQLWTNSLSGAIFRCTDATNGVWDKLITANDMPGSETLESDKVEVFTAGAGTMGTVVTQVPGIQITLPKAGKYEVYGAFAGYTNSANVNHYFEYFIGTSVSDPIGVKYRMSLNGENNTTHSYDMTYQVEVTGPTTLYMYGGPETGTRTFSHTGHKMMSYKQIPTSVIVPISASGYGILDTRDPLVTDNKASDSKIAVGVIWTNTSTGDAFRCSDHGGVDGTGNATWVEFANTANPEAASIGYRDQSGTIDSNGIYSLDDLATPGGTQVVVGRQVTKLMINTPDQANDTGGYASLMLPLATAGMSMELIIKVNDTFHVERPTSGDSGWKVISTNGGYIDLRDGNADSALNGSTFELTTVNFPGLAWDETRKRFLQPEDSNEAGYRPRELVSVSDARKWRGSHVCFDITIENSGNGTIITLPSADGRPSVAITYQINSTSANFNLGFNANGRIRFTSMIQSFTASAGSGATSGTTTDIQTFTSRDTATDPASDNFVEALGMETAFFGQFTYATDTGTHVDKAAVYNITGTRWDSSTYQITIDLIHDHSNEY